MRRLARLMLVVLVSLGLLMGPLAAPVMAEGGNSSSMQSMGSVESMDNMDEMPCCPDQHDNSAKSCANCPLLVLCGLGLFVPPALLGLKQQGFAQTAFAFGNDLDLEGLGARPPDHPPRLIV